MIRIAFTNILCLFTFLSCSNVALRQSAFIHVENRIYKLWDNTPAHNRGHDYDAPRGDRGYPYDQDWEHESYLIGNSFMGANIFGRTDTERIQLTEKTLCNNSLYGKGGLANFAELYLDFGHDTFSNYTRTLNLNEAIHYVNYEYEGVQYSREYFANYPDNVIVVKLSADQKNKISCIIRPEIPYPNPEDKENARTGKIAIEENLISLSGNIKHFNVNYEAQIKVLPQGGRLIKKGETALEVVEANTLLLLLNADTNYELIC